MLLFALVVEQACRVAVGMDPSIPVLRPDMCVVNHYNAASRLGWHQGARAGRRQTLRAFALGVVAVVVIVIVIVVLLTLSPIQTRGIHSSPPSSFRRSR